MEALCWRSVKKTIIFGGIILPLNHGWYRKTRFQGPFRDENSLRLNCAITAVVRFRIKSTAPRCCCRRKGRQRASQKGWDIYGSKAFCETRQILMTRIYGDFYINKWPNLNGDSEKTNPLSKRAWGWQWLLTEEIHAEMGQPHFWNCDAKNGRK